MKPQVLIGGRCLDLPSPVTQINYVNDTIDVAVIFINYIDR